MDKPKLTFYKTIDQYSSKVSRPWGTRKEWRTVTDWRENKKKWLLNVILAKTLEHKKHVSEKNKVCVLVSKIGLIILYLDNCTVLMCDVIIRGSRVKATREYSAQFLQLFC